MAASEYAAPTQTNLSPPLRSWVTVGSVVATAVMSRALRTLHTVTATKDSQNVAGFLYELDGEAVMSRVGVEEVILKLVLRRTSRTSEK